MRKSPLTTREYLNPPVKPREDGNKQCKSLGGFGKATKPVVAKQYTGTAILGIATMHKSNAVPVFSDTEAKELATMRRG